MGLPAFEHPYAIGVQCDAPDEWPDEQKSYSLIVLAKIPIESSEDGFDDKKLGDLQSAVAKYRLSIAHDYSFSRVIYKRTPNT